MLEVPDAGESSPLSFLLSQIILGFGDRYPLRREGLVQGEETSASLLGEPRNLLALRDKIGGGVLSKCGTYSHHSQLLRIRPSLGQ